MKSDNIVAVIEKLGEIIIHNKNDISYLEYENEKLREEIAKIEEKISYYIEQLEQNVADSDYKENIK